MKRFGFYFCLAFASGVFAFQHLPAASVLYTRFTPWLLVLALLGFLHRKHPSIPVLFSVLLGLCLGGSYTQLYTDLHIAPAQALAEETHILTASVRDWPEEYEDSQRVVLRVDPAASGLSAPSRAFDLLAYLPLTDTPLVPGDEVTAQLRLYLPTARGGFDRLSYLLSEGQLLSASYTKTEEDTPLLFTVQPAESHSLREHLLLFSHDLGERISAFLPSREGGFLRSLVLGDRTNLDPIDNQNLKKTGLSHIIAVSGMHLTFLIGMVYLIFSRHYGIPVSIFVVLLFIPMTGASPSIVRAGLMSIFSSIALICEQEMDQRTNWGWALLILLLVNPYSINSLSLQLSFLSTLGLILFSRPLEQLLFHRLYSEVPEGMASRLLHAAGAATVCSLCAILMTTPVLISSFGYLSILAPLSGFLTLGATGAAFLLGLLFCMLPFLDIILAPLLTWISRYILWTAEQLGKLQWGILQWDLWSGRAAILCLVLLIVILLLACRIRKIIWAAPILTASLICLVTMHALENDGLTRITLHHVGSGQMITIAAGQDAVSVIDCGSSTTYDSAQMLREYLNWNNFEQIETLVLTAVDAGHARSITQILETIPVKQVFIPSDLRDTELLQNLLDTTADTDTPVYHWSGEGERAIQLEGVHASLLGGTPRKLAVRLSGESQELLVLHSFTQNMLRDLLQATPTLSAPAIVLSNQLEKEDLLAQALHILKPDMIYLCSDYPAPEKLEGIPVQNTFDSGDLCLVWPRV